MRDQPSRILVSISSRKRKLIGFLLAAIVGAGLAVVSHALDWRDDTTQFAGCVATIVFILLLLPFVMGPLRRLPMDHPDYQPRSSLWPLAPMLLAPAAGYLGYLLARPHTVHWGTAGMIGIFAGLGWLLLSALDLPRPDKKPTSIGL
jgi:hypothetical protein